MIFCDLCGQVKECLHKEIDGKEFDICADCWRPLEEKLKGKGRVKKAREMVFLPPPLGPEREPEEPKPLPGQPPKIFGRAERANWRRGSVSASDGVFVVSEGSKNGRVAVN